MKLMATIALTALVLLGTTPAAAADDAAPLITVVGSERKRLAQPIHIRVAGQSIPYDDVLILYLKLARIDPFLQKGMRASTVVLGDTPTLPLYPPLTGVWALVAPYPGAGPAMQQLWVAAPDAHEWPRQQLQAVAANMRNTIWSTTVGIDRATSFEAANEPRIEDLNALTRHALQRAEAIGAAK
jgi:hypothetical protein